MPRKSCETLLVNSEIAAPHAGTEITGGFSAAVPENRDNAADEFVAYGMFSTSVAGVNPVVEQERAVLGRFPCCRRLFRSKSPHLTAQQRSAYSLRLQDAIHPVGSLIRIAIVQKLADLGRRGQGADRVDECPAQECRIVRQRTGNQLQLPPLRLDVTVMDGNFCSAESRPG